MRTKLAFNTFLLIAAAGVAGTAQATSCMVIGDSNARVDTEEGRKSPVFITSNCEALRLVSGKAMVSWISRDGKPNFSAIGQEGVARIPAKGAEERSAKVVWSELTSNREAQRPAFMRALDEERPARIYIPEKGLRIAVQPGHLRILALPADGAAGPEVFAGSTADAGGVVLTRQQLVPGGIYSVEWRRDEAIERWHWKVLGADEAARIDQPYREIQETLADEGQQRLVTAMLFDQLKLGQNRALLLAQGR